MKNIFVKLVSFFYREPKPEELHRRAQNEAEKIKAQIKIAGSQERERFEKENRERQEKQSLGEESSRRAKSE